MSEEQKVEITWAQWDSYRKETAQLRDALRENKRLERQVATLVELLAEERNGQ